MEHQTHLLVDDNVSRIRPRSTYSRRNSGRVGFDDDPGRKGHVSSIKWSEGRPYLPVINRLVQAEEDKVQILEHSPLLDLVAEKQVYCIGEGDECTVQHELVFRGVADDVEDEVERVLVYRQMRVVQDDVACAQRRE